MRLLGGLHDVNREETLHFPAHTAGFPPLSESCYRLFFSNFQFGHLFLLFLATLPVSSCSLSISEQIFHECFQFLFLFVLVKGSEIDQFIKGFPSATVVIDAFLLRRLGI